MGDYLSGPEQREPALILAQSLLYSYELWQNLKARGAFTITLAFESPGYTPGSEMSDANVRFNKNRGGRSCADLEDLDGYTNAMLVFDTSADLDRELKTVFQTVGISGEA